MSNPKYSQNDPHWIARFSVNGLISGWDYISLVQGSSPYTDTWTWYQGGAGGTALLTVVITYTDSTRSTISNVTKS